MRYVLPSNPPQIMQQHFEKWLFSTKEEAQKDNIPAEKEQNHEEEKDF